MPKTKTFSPQFMQLGGNDGDALTLIIAPIDTDGRRRGDLFSLRVLLNGSAIIGPDNATVVAPVPPAILNASVATGAAPIQAEIDILDLAGSLNNYY